MLYVFFGKGSVRARDAAYTCAALYEKEGMQLIRIDTESYQQGIVRDASGGSSLFGEKHIYFIDTPSEDAAFNEEVMDSLPILQESDHIFIVVEGSLLAAAKKAYKAHAEKMEELDAEVHDSFNVFALADSLSRKDKKSLWMGLCEARKQGSSSEEIIGTLWWQLKTLLLSSRTSNAAEAGMKDFPYNKAKRSLSNFKEGEVELLMDRLLLVYHQGHQGEADIDASLEQFVLSI